MMDCWEGDNILPSVSHPVELWRKAVIKAGVLDETVTERKRGGGGTGGERGRRRKREKTENKIRDVMPCVQVTRSGR